MKPLHDLVLVRVDEAPTRTASGLHLVEQWKTLPPTGTVEGVGPEVKNVKVGDRILFARYSAVQVGAVRETEDKGLRMIKESHVWAIIDLDAVVSNTYA